MPDLNAIYQKQNVEYEAMISREDYQGHLLASLLQLTPLAGKVVVDTGAGTGRLARLLAPLVEKVYAFDLSFGFRSAHMLQMAFAKLCQSGFHNWTISVGDHQQIEFFFRIPIRGADLARDALASQAVVNHQVILPADSDPQCTGIWWKKR